jgi:hypothetical protein
MYQLELAVLMYQLGVLFLCLCSTVLLLPKVRPQWPQRLELQIFHLW